MDRIIRNVRGVCAILKYYSFTGGQRGTNENEIPPVVQIKGTILNGIKDAELNGCIVII